MFNSLKIWLYIYILEPLLKKKKKKKNPSLKCPVPLLYLEEVFDVTQYILNHQYWWEQITY
jgi:hypothetical protein